MGLGVQAPGLHWGAGLGSGLGRDRGFILDRGPAGAQLEKLMENMRAEVGAHPPVEGSFAPRRGDFCIAKFVDGEW